MVYLKSVENVITLGKLIGLLFSFCLPLLSILFLKTKRNNLARPVMGTIFLIFQLTNITHAYKYADFVPRFRWSHILGIFTLIRVKQFDMPV